MLRWRALDGKYCAKKNVCSQRDVNVAVGPYLRVSISIV